MGLNPHKHPPLSAQREDIFPPALGVCVGGGDLLLRLARGMGGGGGGEGEEGLAQDC